MHSYIFYCCWHRLFWLLERTFVHLSMLSTLPARVSFKYFYFHLLLVARLTPTFLTHLLLLFFQLPKLQWYFRASFIHSANILHHFVSDPRHCHYAWVSVVAILISSVSKIFVIPLVHVSTCLFRLIPLQLGRFSLSFYLEWPRWPHCHIHS